jgi:hypothetical protein
MSHVSLAQFRASLQVGHQLVDEIEKAFVYWSKAPIDRNAELTEDALRIMRRPNGSFYLEIGNLIHEGELSALEETLFNWARDEGWLTIDEDE